MRSDSCAGESLSERDKLQYIQALETLRLQYSLMISVISLFATADLALLGFAVQQKMPLLSILAIFVPLGAYLAVMVFRYHMSPLICVAMNIENKNGIYDGIVSTYTHAAYTRDGFAAVSNSIVHGDEPLGERVRKANRATLRYFLEHTLKWLLLVLLGQAIFAGSMVLGFAQDGASVVN